ncbi:MAG: biotin--[acetyl-CoA-carboxylase] ligase [Candidatus Neomarinimicrobiota bacterium]
MLSITKIQEKLTGQWIGKKIKYYSELNSTNKKAWELITTAAQAGTVVITDNQTEGRGRGGRLWESSPGKGLTFTIILYPGINAELAGIYPLLTGLALIEALAVFKVIAKLKWPNDIILGGKKLGGILCESKLAGLKLNQLIIGIGLNINEPEFQQGLKAAATSLFMETGLYFDREKVLAEILNRLESNLHEFNKNGQEIILKTWEKHCFHLKEEISFHYGDNIIKGKFMGLGSGGAAKIKTRDRELYFPSGEII